MKIGAEIVGDLAGIMRAEEVSGKRAVTAVISAAGDEVKQDWRDRIQQAGLGQRLGNTVRSSSFPTREDSFNATALVWSKAERILASHSRGVTIRASAGQFLAIPTEAAGRGARGARLTPTEWERRRGLKLRLVSRRGRPSLLVAEARVTARGAARASRSKTGRGLATVPIFVLVPQVSLRKRLDLDAGPEKVAQEIDARIVERWLVEERAELRKFA